jgi:uncharacterized protein (TIGR02302 family)
VASSDRPNAALSKLNWVLGLTRLGLLCERVIRAFWPLWSVVFVVLAALMLGFQDSLSVEIVWAFGLFAVIATVWFLIRGILKLRIPSRDEALKRLDETLPGRPVRSLIDQPAMGTEDAATRAIWAAHQKRMAAAVSSARAPKPDLRVSRLDPFGLRFIAVLGLAVALIFGSVGRVGSIAAMGPTQTAAATGASWEGWIEPPSYTGMPTLYLNDQAEGLLIVPVNSRVILRLYGEVGVLTVQETVSARLGELPSVAAPEQEFTLRQAGALEIAGPGGRRWDVSLRPDEVPTVETTTAATTSGRGEMSLPFEAQDDYGVTGGTAIIALDLANVPRQHGLKIEPENVAPVELQLPMPINGRRKEFQETLIEDFSEHPWAHLPVTVTLQVSDAAGQQSAEHVEQMDLPARRFFDPLANAIVEQRRDLLWSRGNAPRVAQMLRAISHRPDEGVFRKETDYLRLRMILRRLERLSANGLATEHRDDIAQALWDLAIGLEEGDLADAIARMQRAQERLAEAMKNGASDEEIARLMQELREATRDYMRQLAQQAPQDGEPQQQQQAQNGMQMSQDDLQRMMDRIQELMEQGRMAEAQQALEEFQRLLENMQVAQGGQSGQSPGEQALNELGETLREQQGLSDQAFRELQEQFNPNAQTGESQGNEGFSGGEGRGQSHDGTGQGQGQQQGQGDGDNGPQGLEGQLADRQQALRQELGRQQSQLPGAGTPEGDAARRALGRAGEAMDQAEEALRNQDLAEAIDRQAEAMEGLREGMRNLGEALAQQQRDQGNQGMAQGGQGDARDPLGRNPGNQGLAGTDEGLLQGEDVYRRARDLLDEIRRRAGEGARPEEERNYLRRLLDRF